MNVSFGSKARVHEPIIERVWYDLASGILNAEIDGIATGIQFNLITEDDFDSPSAVERFSVGCKGAVVICHHEDGEETWLPSDMWLPGGFTPVRNTATTISRTVDQKKKQLA